MINSNHSKITEILGVKTAKSKQRKVRQLTDIALLSQGLLKGEELNKFIERSIDLV